MTTIEEIKEAIKALPEGEFSSFKEWFAEHYWSSWDEKIASDSSSGKLCFLVREASA